MVTAPENHVSALQDDLTVTDNDIALFREELRAVASDWGIDLHDRVPLDPSSSLSSGSLYPPKLRKHNVDYFKRHEDYERPENPFLLSRHKCLDAQTMQALFEVADPSRVKQHQAEELEEKKHQALYFNYVCRSHRTKRHHSSGEDDHFTGKESVPPDISGLSKRELCPLAWQENRPTSSTPTLPSYGQISSVPPSCPSLSRQKCFLFSSSIPNLPSNDQPSFILPLHSLSHYPTSPPASPPPHSIVQESKSQLHLTDFPTSPLDDQQTFVPNAYRPSSPTSQSENPSIPFAQESQSHFHSQLSSAIPNIPDVDSSGTSPSRALTDTSPILNAGSPPSTQAAPDPHRPPATYTPTHHRQGSPQSSPPPSPVNPNVQSLADGYRSVPHGTPSWVRTPPTEPSPSARKWRYWSNITATVMLILSLISTIVAILSLLTNKHH